MPFGMEVGLGPGHIVLDGDPAPPKGALAVNGLCCVDVPLTNYSLTQPKGHSPNYRPMSVVAKRLDRS